MQQHEYPSHSMHFVFPPAPAPPLPVASAGLTMLSAMDVAALPGPLRLTRVPDVPQAMLFVMKLTVSKSERMTGRSMRIDCLDKLFSEC